MTIRDLERHPLFRRTLWKRNGYLLLVLLLELLLLCVLACFHVKVPHGETQVGGHSVLDYEVYFLFSWRSLLKFAVLVAVQVGLAHWVFRKSLHGEGRISLYPQDNSGHRRLGGLRGPELVALIQKLALDFGVGKIDHIVISENPDPNAYTARMLGLGNVVVIHSNLLELLPRSGVQAVLAHELAHVRRRDSLLYQVARLPTACAVLIASLAFLKLLAGLLESETVLEFLARACFFALAVFLSVRAFRLLRRLGNLASQQSELLADAYAASRCGWDTILNALLLIGERAEALGVLCEGLKGVARRLEGELSTQTIRRILNRFPPREMNEARARALAPRLYIEDELELLREKLCVPLSSGEIGNLAARAARALDKVEAAEASRKDKESTEHDAEHGLVLTNWHDFDTRHVGRLSVEEAGVLVAELRKDPKRMIFRHSLDPDAPWESHPTMRVRILHLYDLFAGAQP